MFESIPWDIIGKSSAAFIGVTVALWLYNRREKRRRTALEFAEIMRDWGLKWFAEAYRMYAVGDYSGLAWKIKEVVGAVRSDEVILSKLDDVFWKVLDHYKDQPERVAQIQQQLERGPGR